MSAFNKIVMLGNLTKDPQLRHTPTGAAVCDLSIASNRRFKAGDEVREETCFVDVTVWGKQAEAPARYLAKGRPVLIEGRLTQQTWQAPDGSRRSKHTITAEGVRFLPSRAPEAA